MVEGGFFLDVEFVLPALYELAKMDGAIVLSSDAKRILYANAQFVPALLPFCGNRYQTQDCGKGCPPQTGALVIAISQRRGVITLYRGDKRYSLQDISVILSKANQALQTLEKYKRVLDNALVNLTALEFDGPGYSL